MVATIWNYFTKTGKDTSKCNRCDHPCKLPQASTTSMRYHLKSKHHQLFLELTQAETSSRKEKRQAVEEIQHAEAQANAAGCPTPKRARRNLFLDGEDSNESAGAMPKYTTYTSGDRRQLQFDMWTTEYLVEASLPFSHVESKAFRKFILRLNPKVTVKAATTFSRTKLPKLFETMQKELDCKLEKDLNDVSCVGFTTDLWTSRANDHFMSLTLHYINAQWEMERFVLTCIPFAGRHTAVRLVKVLDGSIKDINGLSMDPSKTRKVVVHDAAANMIATCPKSELGLQSFLCMDHRLQTILKKAFTDIPAQDALMRKATDLASRCHHSALTCEIIRAEAEVLGATYVKVITPAPTRWNSHYMMVESILTLKATLQSLREKNENIGVR